MKTEAMQVSVAQSKTKLTAVARKADAGEEVVITLLGRPAYRRPLPINKMTERKPFPDITALATRSKPFKDPERTGANGVEAGSFVAVWRVQNERF